MEMPSLTHTFPSIGFINPEAIQNKDKGMSMDMEEAFESLNIDMVKVEDQEANGTRLPSFPRDKFWTIGPLSNFLLFLNSKMSNDHEQLGVSA